MSFITFGLPAITANDRDYGNIRSSNRICLQFSLLLPYQLVGFRRQPLLTRRIFLRKAFGQSLTRHSFKISFTTIYWLYNIIKVIFYITFTLDYIDPFKLKELLYEESLSVGVVGEAPKVREEHGSFTSISFEELEEHAKVNDTKLPTTIRSYNHISLVWYSRSAFLNLSFIRLC